MPLGSFAIALYYFTFLGALGIFWPYFTLYLHAQGLSPTQATRVLSVYPFMGLCAPPLIGLFADARRARGWLLRLASFGTLVSFVGFFFAGRAIAALVLVTAAFALFRAPLLSMTDATAFDCVRKHGGSYGRLRMWGSVGFLCGAVGGGLLLEGHGMQAMLMATTGGLALQAACAWRMPAEPPEKHPEVVAVWLRMLAAPELWILLLAVALAQAAGAAYDACFSLHLRRLGLGHRWVGAAWAIGVGAEVVLMAYAQPLLRRFGTARLFAGAILTGAVRWFLIARVRDPYVLVAMQPLHGISFGFFYVTGVTLVRERSDGAPTAAQGLFAGALALGSTAGMQLAGGIYERSGGSGLFGAASAVALVATGCAAYYAACYR